MSNIAHLADQARFRTRRTPALSHTIRPWMAACSDFAEVEVSTDEADGILWQKMKPAERPNLSFRLLSELFETFNIFKKGYQDDIAAGRKPLKYLALSSNVPGIFSLGGDLSLFVERIQNGDKASLKLYAYRCIDVVHAYATSLGNMPIHTIALVQGDALGGGFEGALANDVIIAEKSARFGLPEVLFNLFPGMGAYTLLSRRLDVARAEKMILSGQIFSADELHAMGLVDVVAEDGQGEAALYDYIEQYERSYGARQSVMKARQIARPVLRAELTDIVDLWVEAAMALDPKDLRKMQVLSKAQDRRFADYKQSRPDSGAPTQTGVKLA